MNILKQLSLLLVLAALAMVGCEKDKHSFEDLQPTVKSFFTIAAPPLELGKEIKFTNASESATSYLWDFGDSTNSTDANPAKKYAKAGIYTVKLKAYGPG